MSDYAENITTVNYRHTQPLYITETTGQKQTFLAIKLSLNSTNFNFDLAKEDGSDFKIALSSNGSGALQHWVAYWSATRERATVFFKLPSLLANQTLELWAFWGYAAATNTSDIRYLTGETVASGTPTPVFIFGDAWNEGSTSLDTSKWTANGTVNLNGSYLTFNTSAYITANTTPLDGYRHWIYEDGFIKPSTPTNDSYYCHGVRFLGGENELKIFYFNEGQYNREHNFVLDTSDVTYNDAGTGIELGSYHNTFVRYYEELDYVYQGMYNRETQVDYEESWERKVLRNTWVTYPRIYGHTNSAAGGVQLLWAIIWEYNPDTYPTVDISNLYVDYDNIGPQPFDPTEYGNDLTSVDYYHETDAGGDPSRLSDNITNSLSNAWVSTTISGYAVIDFVRKSEDLTDPDYFHFDNNHVSFYGAHKLSDDDNDPHSRTYWLATTDSDVWASIRFPVAKGISTLSVRAVPSRLSGMIQNYNIYGTNVDPRVANVSDKILLKSGTFLQTTDAQIVYLGAAGRKYRFYILEAVDTFGANVALQEWKMYESTGENFRKRVVTQIRLRPLDFDSHDEYFPKNFEIYGSNDFKTWTYIAGFETFTPFRNYYTYGRWQRYTFTNYNAYYAYKILFTGNWGGDDNIMKVAEWEMVEQAAEESNYRILGGTTNNFNSVWADPATTFDSGHIYAANDSLSTILGTALYNTTTISGVIDDINVVL